MPHITEEHVNRLLDLVRWGDTPDCVVEAVKILESLPAEPAAGDVGEAIAQVRHDIANIAHDEDALETLITAATSKAVGAATLGQVETALSMAVDYGTGVFADEDLAYIEEALTLIKSSVKGGG
jgi:hypothetical protein